MSQGSPESPRSKSHGGSDVFEDSGDTVDLVSTTVCKPDLDDSRASSIATTGDWEEQECWLASMANSESCPVSSSSGTSPLTGTSSQGVSPGIAVHLDQSFPFSIPDDLKQPNSSHSLSSISDVLQVEKDFMDYVMSFPPPGAPPPMMNTGDSQKTWMAPTTTTAAATTKRPHQNETKVGLDHLDNLCKLMEQLSDLKESNIKLKRRVQYLEDIKTLHEIHKEMVGERTLYSSGLSDEEAMRIRDKADGHLKPPEKASQKKDMEDRRMDGLYRSKTATLVPSAVDYSERGHKSRSVSSNKERRERSKSVGHAKPTKKHPSRWSKVKEVLGIDKTDDQSTTLEGEKSDELSGNKHYSGERRERTSIRSARKDMEHPKTHKLSASKSHSSILSSRSFTEISRQGGPDTGLKKSSSKTPWGKMKTMIQIRRDNRQKSESSSSSPLDPKGKIGPPDPTNGHHPTTKRNNARQNHRFADGQPVSPELPKKYSEDTKNGFFHHQKIEGERHHQQKHRRSNTALDAECKVKGEATVGKSCQQEDYYGACGSTVTTKEVVKNKKHAIRPLPLDNIPNEPQALYAEEDSRGATRSPGCSPLSQRKWMWTKMKDVLKGKKEDSGHISCSVSSSPVSVAEGTAFDFEIVDKTEDSSLNSVPQSNRASESGPDNPPLPCSSPSTTVAELLRELQQNLSDDFNKKLEEWQKCRAEGSAIKCPPSPVVERKDSFGRLRKISKPEKKVSSSDKVSKSHYHIQKKDLSWLEKEHQKVEREIVRLSKEKEKFEKRAFRLLHLKEAMAEGDGLKKEVLVKTSAGEFRFEGISDAFTKKLYEWETKKGVGPELSTIALLDESLKPCIESAMSPSVVVQQVGSNSTRPSPEPKNCFQVSRASSEPDLFSSSQKDTNSVSSHQAIRSKSGDTLLAGDNKEMVANLEEDVSRSLESPREVVVHHGDDSYYSLLEENMYLLDQLKEKEEICGQLQNELDRLDDRTEQTNRTHQEEMEKYRQKLWEIHMSRPRDLQGSLQLISELKSRIEELQKCSDKLKSDREQLEESFRFHSDQQARLADDLIRRVRELQETPMAIGRGGCRRKWRKIMKCDTSSVSRIHDLSTKLLQQARDVEQTLMERTRQVCHLRWELLHRDMSAVLLQAALHRVTSQGEPLAILPTWDKRRNKFKSLKAWSVDTTTRCQSQDGVADDWLQDRLRQLSMTPYSDWASIDFSPNDLMTTAHELKRETLKLSIARPDRVSDSEEKKSATCSADSEMADSDRYYDTGSAVNSRSSSFSSGGPGGLRGSHSDTRLYERARALRRNSSSSMSCVDASDSSSVQDSDRMHCMVKKFPWRTQWRSLDNVSSSCSSRSSVLEDDSSRTHWRQPKSLSRIEVLAHEEATACGPLQLKYGSFKEVDEENEDSKSEVAQKSPDWSNHCLITPRPLHLGRASDTEWDRQRRIQGTQKKIFSRHPDSVSQKIIEPTPLYGRMISQTFDSTTVRTGALCTSHESMMREFREFNAGVTAVHEPRGSKADSLESLDKYETAIRDDELFSDEHSARSTGDERHIRNLETFADSEDSLKTTSSKASDHQALMTTGDERHKRNLETFQDSLTKTSSKAFDHQALMATGDERHRRNLETFADFEDSLKRRTSGKAFDHQTSMVTSDERHRRNLETFADTEDSLKRASSKTHDHQTSMATSDERHRRNLETFTDFEDSLKRRTTSSQTFTATGDERHRHNLETFADFEDSLKRRTSSRALDHQTAMAPHNCISDYIHRDRAIAAECAVYQTAPGSPNISKFKYKGTKGFGKSSRQTFATANESIVLRPYECPEDLRTVESEIVHLDV